MSTAGPSAFLSMQTPTLDNTLGAIFLGLVFSCMLYGVSSLQVYFYYHYYPNDSRLQKISVGILWVLDSLHLALTIFSTYHYAVRGFGNIAGLSTVLSPIKLLIAINVVIVLMVQSLYAYRVWLLGGYHHGVLGYLVAGVVLGGFVIGIVLAVETYISVHTWADAELISWAVEASFAASTFIDVVISCAMCYYLRKSKGSERALNSRISTLMQYTLSCGVFTSACSITCLFTFVLLSNTLIFLAMTYILTRLYVTSFMAMMNARARQRPSRAESSFALSHSQSQSQSFTATRGLAYVQRSVSVKTDLLPMHRSDAESGRTYPSPDTAESKYGDRDWDAGASPVASPPTARTLGSPHAEHPFTNAYYAREW